jgi:hypothetical protein
MGSINHDGTGTPITEKLTKTIGIIKPKRNYKPEGEMIRGLGGYGRDPGLQRYSIELVSYPFTFNSGPHDSGDLDEFMKVVRMPFKFLQAVTGPYRHWSIGEDGNSVDLGNWWETFASITEDNDGVGIGVSVRPDYNTEEDDEGRETLLFTLDFLERINDFG